MNVRLQWNRNSESDVTGYNVYRSTTSGGPYNKINAALVPQTAVGVSPIYADVPPSNATFFYVVRAVNASGLESGNSNEAVANPPAVPPAPPTGLAATVTTTASLAVDGIPVASASGTPPFALNYTLPRSTPPRDRALRIGVVA